MHIKYITIKILKPLAQLSLYNLKKKEKANALLSKLLY